MEIARTKGDQAVQDVYFGEYRFDPKTGKGSVANVKTYAADCVMPPDGSTPGDWIKAGFPGAKCK